MEYWIIYHLETGNILFRGSGSTGTAAIQPLPEGAAIVLVPPQVVAQPEIDLEALRVAVVSRIDVSAEVTRMRFLTPGAGQAMTYTRKESEARAWLADNDAATPFLLAEAAARGVSVGQVAGEVVAQADAWVTMGARIEGLRMGAKAALADATTFGGIVSAAAVEWPA